MPARMQTGPIRVLIVDDSPFVRSLLTKVLSDKPDIQVVGAAKDPYEARELIIGHRPEAILLDIEMPRMDGLTFLKKLMEHYPVPVIMCTGVAPANSKIAIEAIECGAIDVVAKPTTGGMTALAQIGEELAEKIRAAATARKPPPPIPATAAPIPTFAAAGLDPRRYVVAVGASTGGTEAIKEMITRVPPDFPPVVIVQHMPEGFTKSFAERLNELSPAKVSEAVDGDMLTPAGRLSAKAACSCAYAPPAICGDSHSERKNSSTATARASTCCSTPSRIPLVQTRWESSSPAWGTMAQRACSTCTTPAP